MTCPVFEQDPLDTRIVGLNFGTWLGADAEISAVSWVVPSGLTESDSFFTATVATNYFSGGTDGEEYEVSCTITTDETIPREKTQRIIIRIVSCEE